MGWSATVWGVRWVCRGTLRLAESTPPLHILTLDSQSSRGPSVPFQQVIVQITKSKKANAHKRMLLRNDMSLKKPGERLEC